LLIVFGGLKGLEGALAHDEEINVDEPNLLFDQYINVLPRQGSRTIRTEEALLIALAALQEKILPKSADIEEDLSQFLPQSEDTGGSLIPQQAFTKKKNKNKQMNGNAEGVSIENSILTKHATSEEANHLPNKKQKFNSMTANSPQKNVQENDQNPFKKHQKKQNNSSSPNKTNPFKIQDNLDNDSFDFEVVPI